MAPESWDGGRDRTGDAPGHAPARPSAIALRFTAPTCSRSYVYAEMIRFQDESS